MPAQGTHYLFGEETLSALSEDFRSGLHLGAFALGCQGPDLFYHNQKTRPGAFVYGSRLHKRSYGEFLTLWGQELQKLGVGPGSVEFSYYLGWLTHGSLDRWLHPFVVYFSGWQDPAKPETAAYRRGHIFFERVLDVKFYQHFRGREFDTFSFFPLWDLLPSEAPLGLVTSLARALWKTYPSVYFWEDAQNRIPGAWKDGVGFLRFTDPQAGHQQASAALDAEDGDSRLAVYHPRILPPEDFLNLNHGPWLHPVTGEEQTRSAVDLFALAQEEVQGILNLFESVWRGNRGWEKLRSAVGDGSLNLQDAQGQRASAQYSKAWDVEHLLSLQRKYWLDVQGRPSQREDL